MKGKNNNNLGKIMISCRLLNQLLLTITLPNYSHDLLFYILTFTLHYLGYFLNIPKTLNDVAEFAINVDNCIKSKSDIQLIIA